MILFKKTKERVNEAIQATVEAAEYAKKAADRMETCERIKVGLMTVIAIATSVLAIQSFRE